MSEPTREHSAFLENIRDEWGPPAPTTPPSPASIRARLEARPWLAEPAPERRMLGGWKHLFGATAATVGLCAVGIVAVRGGSAPTESMSAPAIVAAPSAAPAAPAVEPGVAIAALPDAPPMVVAVPDR